MGVVGFCVDGWFIPYPLGPRLGQFNMNMAKDLGLLAMDATTATISELAVPGVPKQGEPSKAPVERAPSKFQLGETLPVVPASRLSHSEGRFCHGRACA